jgi:hypothetical protein
VAPWRSGGRIRTLSGAAEDRGCCRAGYGLTGLRKDHGGARGCRHGRCTAECRPWPRGEVVAGQLGWRMAKQELLIACKEKIDCPMLRDRSIASNCWPQPADNSRQNMKFLRGYSVSRHVYMNFLPENLNFNNPADHLPCCTAT